jgi:hypothetical protein
MTERPMISAPYVVPNVDPCPRCSHDSAKVWHVDTECQNEPAPAPAVPTVVVADKDCGCGGPKRAG